MMGACIVVTEVWPSFLELGAPLFFFNDPATPEIYTLSLHDALPILMKVLVIGAHLDDSVLAVAGIIRKFVEDRKSTRLNSSHSQISDAGFFLRTKKKGSKGAQAAASPEPTRRTSAARRGL